MGTCTDRFSAVSLGRVLLLVLVQQMYFSVSSVTMSMAEMQTCGLSLCFFLYLNEFMVFLLNLTQEQYIFALIFHLYTPTTEVFLSFLL